MEKEIWLQGHGYQRAIEVKDLKVGTVIMRNFGYTSKIRNLEI